jgi:hypothetical protein
VSLILRKEGLVDRARYRWSSLRFLDLWAPPEGVEPEAQKPL